ncbi:cyclin [Cryptosporidium felis]|nr:cyclin [Cryptosporidium felis]
MAELEDVLNEISSYEWENDLAKIICGSLVNLNGLIEDLSDAELNERLKEPKIFGIFECFYEPLLYYKNKHNLPPNRPDTLDEHDNEFVSKYPLLSESENKSLEELFRYGKTPKVSIRELFGFVLSVLHFGRFNFSSFVLSVMNIRGFVKKIKIPVCQHNWRPIFVTSLILSDKQWDDNCAKSGDLTKIVGFVSPKVMCYLELVFCMELDWRLVCDLGTIKDFISEVIKPRLDPVLIDEVINSEIYQSYCSEGINESSQNKNQSSLEKLENKNMMNYSNSDDSNSIRPGVGHQKRAEPPLFTIQGHHSKAPLQQPQIKMGPSTDKSRTPGHYGLNPIGAANGPGLQMATLPKSGYSSLQRSFYYSPARAQVGPGPGIKPKFPGVMGSGMVPPFPGPNMANLSSTNFNVPRNHLRSMTPGSNFQKKLASPGKNKEPNFEVAPKPSNERGRDPSCSALNHPASRMSSNPGFSRKVPTVSAVPRQNGIKRSSSEHSRLHSNATPEGFSKTPNTAVAWRNGFFSAARNTVSSAITSITRTFGLSKVGENDSLNSNISFPKPTHAAPQTNFSQKDLVPPSHAASKDPHPQPGSAQSKPCESQQPQPRIPPETQPFPKPLAHSNPRNLSVPPNSNPAAPYRSSSPQKGQNQLMRALSTERNRQPLPTPTQGLASGSHLVGTPAPIYGSTRIPPVAPPASTTGTRPLHANFGRQYLGRGPCQVAPQGGLQNLPSVRTVAGGETGLRFNSGRNHSFSRVGLGSREPSLGARRSQGVSGSHESPSPSLGGVLGSLLSRFGRQNPNPGRSSGFLGSSRNPSPAPMNDNLRPKTPLESLGNFVNPIGSLLRAGGPTGLSGRGKASGYTQTSQTQMGGNGGALGSTFRYSRY